MLFLISPSCGRTLCVTLSRLTAFAIVFLKQILDKVWNAFSNGIHIWCPRSGQVRSARSIQPPTPRSASRPPSPIALVPVGAPQVAGVSKSSSPLATEAAHPPTSPLGDEDEESECPICCEEMNEMRPPTTGAPCGHILCLQCRERIIEATGNYLGPTCHMCRVPYDATL